jgi:hypothetical protein
MPDNYLLAGLGTVLNLGSWLQAEPAPEFGTADLRRPEYSENAYTEGGVLAYQRSGVRTMTFPLLLASSGTYAGLDGLAAHIQDLALSPGAYVDLMPHDVATAQAVRFDVVHGELRHRNYSPHVQRHHYRTYDLVLRTQPFGYLPTWITLASAASIGLPGVASIPAASIFGDAPGLVRLHVDATAPANATQVGTWIPDVLAWSLAGRAALVNPMPGASWINALPGGAGGYYANGNTLTGTSLLVQFSPTHLGWTTMAYHTIASANELAARGRHRAWLFAHGYRHNIGGWNALQLSLDAVPETTPSAPMGSAAQIATMMPPQASNSDFEILDMGEITIPPLGSGIGQGCRLRLWFNKATYAATSDVGFDFDGLWLQPLGPAGVMPRGLAWPDYTTPSMGRFALDAYSRSALVGMPTGNLASVLPVRDALEFYRGDMPKVGGSAVRLDVLAAARRAESATAYIAEVLRDSPLFYYRMDETSGAQLTDLSGNARHGSYANAGSYNQPGAFDVANERAHFFDGSADMARAGSHTALNPAASSWTIEYWATRQKSVSDDEIAVAHGTQAANYRTIQIGWHSESATEVNGAIFYGHYADDLTASVGVTDPGWHHYVFSFNRASRLQSIWLDASCVATRRSATTVQSTGPFWFGNPSGIVGFSDVPFPGGLSEVAFYAGVLPADRVRAHYEAGVGASWLMTRPAPLRAAVSVQYRPRFSFISQV